MLKSGIRHVLGEAGLIKRQIEVNYEKCPTVDFVKNTALLAYSLLRTYCVFMSCLNFKPCFIANSQFVSHSKAVSCYLLSKRI